MDSKVHTIRWERDHCVVLDQTLLPSQTKYVSCMDYRALTNMISRLGVRGAPAIGIAGAYAVVLAYQEALKFQTTQEKEIFLNRALDEIATSRPTAINLRWAVSKMKEQFIQSRGHFSNTTYEELLQLAVQIHKEDLELNSSAAIHGEKLISSGSTLMTYCNTGALATGGVGTALGVILEAFKQGKVNHVYVCETRPLLQGSRLTAWELEQYGIPYTLICDNMAAWVMGQKKVSAAFVGADRIAKNGDTANKIGTFSLAVLAKYHELPFYVVAPSSTFDLSIETGQEIPIEERSSSELLDCLGDKKHPFDVPTFNPAFDVTPHTLISAIVSDRGVIHKPNASSIQKFFET